MHLLEAGLIPSAGLASDQDSLEGAKFQEQISERWGIALAFQ